MKNKKKIYICGPISGDDIEERRAAFAAVESMLEAEGLVVVNPMKVAFPEGRTPKPRMRVRFELLIGCDYIYLMNDWDSNFVAVFEYIAADITGLEVYANEQFLSYKNAEHIASVEASLEMKIKSTPGTHIERVRDYISRKGGNAQ